MTFQIRQPASVFSLITKFVVNRREAKEKRQIWLYYQANKLRLDAVSADVAVRLTQAKYELALLKPRPHDGTVEDIVEGLKTDVVSRASVRFSRSLWDRCGVSLKVDGARPNSTPEKKYSALGELKN